MDAEKIVRLSPDVIGELLDSQRTKAIKKEPEHEQRNADRWPFPGTVEVWLPPECYGDRHVLATLHNLSRDGLAMRLRCPLPVGGKISLALHQPELSCYGHAIVRHCTQAAIGYLVGVEFCYPHAASDDDDE
ncbi:MAG: PilZ domain-containing protein [Phycisphaerae bacterium]|nr:PilZ domain-containing protein [Phycisphaerae bacterium]